MPSTTQYEAAAARYSIVDSQVVKAEQDLVAGAQNDFLAAFTALGLYLDSGVVLDDTAADLLHTVAASIMSLNDKLLELGKFMGAEAEVRGVSTYAVDPTTESLEELRQAYRDTSTPEKEKLQELLGDLGEKASGTVSFGTKLGNWVKFIILAVLVIGGIVGTIYVRLLYGEHLGFAAGLLGAVVIGAYVWFSYMQLVINVALVALCIAAVIAAVLGLLAVLRGKTLINSIEQIKAAFPQYEKEISSILSSKLGSTKGFVRKIKAANKITAETPPVGTGKTANGESPPS